MTHDPQELARRLKGQGEQQSTHVWCTLVPIDLRDAIITALEGAARMREALEEIASPVTHADIADAHVIARQALKETGRE